MAKTLATRMAFGQEIIEIAKTNENFVVCNADTKTCGLEKFGKYFTEREFSFGIAEQNLVAASAGMAACGNKVFLATFAVFASMRACEQVRTFVCYPNLNVTVIGTHAGLQVGGDGATHAAIEDVSIMRSFPNMTVVQPADAVAARALAHAAVDFTGPLYVRLHRNPVADLYDPATYKFEWGKANTVVDNGSDMTMIVSGILLKKALDAAAILNEQGISVLVLDMATSTVAKGKIALALKEGKSIPDNWALAPDGSPTTDPAVANKGALTPLGGAKGYALALIIDVICCCLCGGNNSRQIPRMFEDPKEPSGVGYFMGAIDIGRFVDLETFKARTDAMYDELKAAPTAPGFREIMIPGEIEFHLTRQAEREGIDISPAIEQDFADLAARYGVPLELLQSC